MLIFLARAEGWGGKEGVLALINVLVSFAGATFFWTEVYPINFPS